MINANLLRRVVEASHDGVVITEQEGDDNIIVYVNPAFERLTGYRAEDILYRDCRFLQGEDRAQPGLPALREALRQRRPVRQVLRNYRKDGTPFWNELSIAPVFNDSDHLTYFIGIQKDVTAEVEAQARTRRLEEELQRLQYELAALRGIL